MDERRVGTGVGVMILNKEGKVLLGLRNEDVSKAGSAFKLSNCWGMPGGKLRYDESFEECAKREVKEETNLDLKSLKLLCVNDNKNEHARFVTMGFLCDDFEGELTIMEPEEILEWRWFDLNNLPENLYFPSARVLENYMQKKFYIPMKQKNIEVEVQTFISKEEYDKLLDFFKMNSEFVKEDLQETYYFDENSNLRIQRNSDGAKLWHKSGNVHDEFMEEIEIHAKRDDFENMEKFLNKLGHFVKIKWIRNRNKFNWNGIKVCVDHTKGYGYILELEKMGNETNKEIILSELKSKLRELGVRETPKDIFNDKYEYYKHNWRELVNAVD